MQVQLLDANWQPVGELLEASPRGVNRIRRNQACTFSFTFPTDSVKASDLDLAANVLLMGRIPGRITRRRVNGPVVEIEGISAEDLLNGFRTPHDWPHWQHRDLADVVRDALKPFRLVRFTQFVGNGWRGRWWKKTSSDYNVLMPDTAPNVDTIHPTVDLTDFSPAGQADYYNGIIDGWITPAYSEAYTIYVTHDDGVRVYLDDQLVIDEWNDSPTLETHSYTTPVLTAGQKYHLRIEHYEKTGGQRLLVEWSSASVPRATIPQSAVVPDTISTVPYASADVDFLTHFGNIILATDPYLGAKRYRASGHVIFRVNLGADALPTGRWVRWSESVGTATHVKVQARVADTEAGLATAVWSPEFEAIHAEDLDLAATEGMPLPDGGPWVEIKFTLSTDDRDTADGDPATVYGYTSVLSGVEIVYRVPGPIGEGNIPASTGKIVRDYVPSRITLLRALVELVNRFGYAFRVRLSDTSLVLDLVEGSFGMDRRADVRLINGENCIIESIDETDMVED